MRMAFEDALNMLISSDIQSIFVFGSDALRFFLFIVGVMDRVLILSEFPQPLNAHFRDSQYIVECCTPLNPYDIFKFIGKGIDSIIYLPSIIFLQARGNSFMPLYKVSIKMFLERVKMVLRVCRFSSLKLILIFNGGTLSIDNALVFSPKFLGFLASLFDITIYCESNHVMII
ncbi:MAG: hypothetical protein NDF57_02605 [archaeon GBS-70-058]|nr:hypothetical protein [Candidatus Culexarchaeum nevadense]